MEPSTREHHRLTEASEQKIPWKKWGPYLSERQWGTVRENLRRDRDAWRGRDPRPGALVCLPQR
jgi:hypothetical protein